MGKSINRKGKPNNRNLNTDTATSVHKSKKHPVPGRDLLKKEPSNIYKWVLFLIGVTALCYIPMLQNQFTNWDDEYYVLNNHLLKNADWKGIFTEPVVGNYHPLTIISLLINYNISGSEPFSYLFLNLLLHLANTWLVFRFINLISGNKTIVAFFTALIFGIHPLHVESVAWISERKDVLYAFFFLLSLIQYWHYLNTGKKQKLWMTFFLFMLSLLSKPAAIVLPLVLLLLDYWHGKPLQVRLLIQKIPFFIMSVVFGILTVNIQSPTAMASLETFPIWVRMFFACHVLMIYFARFFIPYPLSAFHPFPPVENLGWDVLAAPLFIVAMGAFLWYQRKNKPVVFGLLFYVINLLLVLQIVTIGSTLVSERYTYIPFIGLAFALAMVLEKYASSKSRQLVYGLPFIVLLVFGIVTFQRTKVWENSGTLWTDVIEKYPDAPIPRTNRANYLSRLALQPEYTAQAQGLYQQALEDCNIALQVKANNPIAYEKRGLIYLDLNRNQEAVADADSLLKYDSKNSLGYDIRATALARMGSYDKAFEDFNKCLQLNPDHHRALNNRGVLLLHYYKKYSEAIADFTKAIEQEPLGKYYLNRSVSYYNLGDLVNAKLDAQAAIHHGQQLTDEYRKQLNMN